MKKIIILFLLNLMILVINVNVVNAVPNETISKSYWFTEKEDVKDYAYSFAVVGDTQVLTEKYPNQLHGIYDWIIANKDSKKIAHVFGLGDITETWEKKDLSEWELAKAAISKMDGVISYSLVRGNHDETRFFNNTFNYEAYTSQFDGFYMEGDLTCSYMTFKAGVSDYLFITLDYGASDDMLEWAGEIINEHINHKVIITTHAYMNRYGGILTDASDNTPCDRTDIDNSPARGYNTGDEIWEKFISKYGNIMLVMSGHEPSDNVYYMQSVGDHGNVVTQMLIDAQWMDKSSPVGMVCMLYFNEDGTKMDVEFYSTVRNEYCKESNQYTVDLSKSGLCAHNYELMFDNTHHWYECGCEAFTGLEPHNFSEVKEFLICDCGLVLRNPNYKKEDKEGCNGAVIPSLVSVGIIGCSIFYLKIKKKED